MTDNEIQSEIERGSFKDVRQLFRAAKRDPLVLKQIDRVCRARIEKGYDALPWNFWCHWSMDPVKFRRAMRPKPLTDGGGDTTARDWIEIHEP